MKVSVQLDKLTVLNVVVLCLLCFVSSEKWLPPTFQVSSYLREEYSTDVSVDNTRACT